MIEISISREPGAAHPGFMAGCAQRGHPVAVFVAIGVWASRPKRSLRHKPKRSE